MAKIFVAVAVIFNLKLQGIDSLRDFEAMIPALRGRVVTHAKHKEDRH